MLPETPVQADTRKLGPIHLLPGVNPSHAITFLFTDLITIGFVAFVVISQTYLMNANLGVPENMQGTITGDMGFWSEVIIIQPSCRCSSYWVLGKPIAFMRRRPSSAMWLRCKIGVPSSALSARAARSVYFLRPASAADYLIRSTRVRRF